MKLILVRHGHAGAYTQPDSERNLTETGKVQAEHTAAWLKQNYLPTQFVSSPYNRARQTLDIISEQWDTPLPRTEYAGITPDADARRAFKGLAKWSEQAIAENGCLIIVCHMNLVAYLAQLLTGEYQAGFSLAEARVYDIDVWAAGAASEIARFIPEQAA